MAETRFFMHPDTLADIIEDVCRDKGLSTISCRHGPGGGCYEFESAGIRDILAKGEFSEIYLSGGAGPESPTDWSFPSREHQDLLVVTGGRMRGDLLERGSVRMLSKSSRVKPAYSAIRGAIRKHSAGQGVTAKGSTMKDVFYDSAALDKTLRENIDSDFIEYTVLR